MARTATLADRRFARVPQRLPAGSSLVALTTIGVWIEVGICVHLLSRGVSPWKIAVVLSLYHVGYLASRGALSEHVVHARVGAVAGAALIAIGMAEHSVPAIAGGAAVFSTCIQSWRRGLKRLGGVSTARKNLGKASGMVGATVFALSGPVSAVLVILVVVVGSAVAHLPSPGAPAISQPRLSDGAGSETPVLLAESLHHAHYFAYVYVFWALTDLSPALVAPAFVLGWAAYFVLERELISRKRAFSTRCFIVGHLVCAAALVVMSAVHDTRVLLAMWAITGIGGGTAYMLGNAGTTGDRELYEDAGHVAGCLLGAAGAAITASAVGATVVGAALAVGAAAALTWHVITKRTRFGT
jgi:hypothetical protein